MINPDGMLEHARRLAGSGRGRPADADLRRGISAAYYALFHDLTDRAARHLIGSSGDEARNRLRRSRTHGEIATLAHLVNDRAKSVAHKPAVPAPKDLDEWGPLGDIAASDPEIVAALRLFPELQEQRHRADYDHDARFDKATLLSACQDAQRARQRLDGVTSSGREALFTLLAVRRRDFRSR